MHLGSWIHLCYLGILSVQTVHIFSKLFKFHIFTLETFCAQVKRQRYRLQSELYCTQIQLISIIFQKEKKKGLLALLGKNGLIFILIQFIEKHFLFFDVVYAKWKHHALPIRIMQVVILSFAPILQKEIACMAGRYPWY